MPRLRLRVRVFCPTDGPDECAEAFVRQLEGHMFPVEIVTTTIFVPLPGLQIPNPIVVPAQHVLAYTRFYKTLQGCEHEPVSILVETQCCVSHQVGKAFKVRVQREDDMLDLLTGPEIRTFKPNLHGLLREHLEEPVSS